MILPDIDKIVALESGELDEEEVVDLIQSMVNSGVIWHLQGSYGRLAQSLIDQGLVTYPQGEEDE